MKRSTVLNIGGDDFECVEFYDVDTGCSGVEVRHCGSWKIVGRVMDISVPDEHDTNLDVKDFEQRIEEMLETEYF